MNCHTMTDAIIDLARGVEVGPGPTAAVESHVRECPACAARFERERALTAGLRALASTTAGQASSDAAERRVLEQFAEQRSKSSSVKARPARGVGRSWLQAAAMLLIGLGVLAVWLMVAGARRPSTLPMTASRAPSTITTPSEVTRPATPPIEPVVAKPGAGGPTGRPGSRSAASRVIRPVGFVPLPNAASLPAFESGHIVRMELPLTSMPFYGVDIPPDARNRPVQADLLVGQDGQARAIRLVISTVNTRTGGP